MLAHVTRFYPPELVCAIFARPIPLFAIQHGGSECPAVKTAARRLPVAALLPFALHAAHLHLSAAPRASGQRALQRLAAAGHQHVAIVAQPAANTCHRRPAAAAPASASTAAHGLAAASPAPRYAAVLWPSSASSCAARPADDGQHGACSVQCRHALPAAATARRPASLVGRSSQEGDQASHKDGVLNVSQAENKGECSRKPIRALRISNLSSMKSCKGRGPRSAHCASQWRLVV